MRGKIVAFLLAVLPVLSIYAVPFVIRGLGLAVLYLIITPLLIYYRISRGQFSNRDSSLKYYWPFSVYVILGLVIFSGGGFDNMSISIALSTIAYWFLISCSNDYSASFIKFYLFFSFAFAVFLIVQYASLFILGVNINGISMLLPTYDGVENSTKEGLLYFRLSSVFTEPSHFALYVVPSLPIVLWDICKMAKWKPLYLVVVSASVLLSTSGNGIILMGLCYALYIMSMSTSQNKKKFIIASFIILIVGYFVVTKFELFSLSTNNLFTAQTKDESKAEIRIYRGFKFYADMNFPGQLLGCGWHHAEDYARQHSQLMTKYGDIEAFDYFNSIAGLLIYTGILGFTLFFVFIKKVWQMQRHKGYHVTAILLFASMFSSSIIFSSSWVLYLAIIYSLSDYINREKQKSLLYEANN